MSESKNELRKLIDLLAIEKEEDYKQYQAQFERSSVIERRKNGVTWYPVRITSEELGYGDYLNIELERTQGLNELHQFGGGKNIELFSNSGEAGSESWKFQGTIKQVWANKMRI